MRFGIELPASDPVGWAERADRAGLGFVVVSAEPGAECPTAVQVALATRAVRVGVRLALTHDNPVTLVEELHVLDQLASGRALAVLTADADVDGARVREELEICVLAGSQRPFAYEGSHWRLPARLPEHTVPDRMMVTPPPAQLRVPLWADPVLPRVTGVEPIAPDATEVGAGVVAPASLRLSGDTTTDLRAAAALRDAGATHCVVTLPAADPEGALERLVRRIAPDSAMVDFPPVVAEVELPAPWPGRGPAEPSSRRDE